MLFLQGSQTYIVFRRWSDVGNTFLPISFLEVVRSSERDIRWSDNGIYLVANWSMLSFGYDFIRQFSAWCVILSDTKVRYGSPSFTIKWLGLLSIMKEEGELVGLTPVLYYIIQML